MEKVSGILLQLDDFCFTIAERKFWKIIGLRKFGLINKFGLRIKKVRMKDSERKASSKVSHTASLGRRANETKMRTCSLSAPQDPHVRNLLAVLAQRFCTSVRIQLYI
jgi:hypothetical protein